MKGYGSNHGPKKYSFTRWLVEGDDLTVSNLKANSAASETSTTYKEVMDDLTKYVFPITNQRCLLLIKGFFQIWKRI